MVTKEKRKEYKERYFEKHPEKIEEEKEKNRLRTKEWLKRIKKEDPKKYESHMKLRKDSVGKINSRKTFLYHFGRNSAKLEGTEKRLGIFLNVRQNGRNIRYMITRKPKDELDFQDYARDDEFWVEIPLVESNIKKLREIAEKVGVWKW